MIIKRGKLITHLGETKRILDISSEYYRAIDRHGYYHYFRKNDDVKPSSARNFPSIRKLKGMMDNSKNERYLIDANLYYFEMYEFAKYVIDNGETIRLRHPTIRDHNPAIRTKHEGIIATIYNDFKPIRVTGSSWEYLLSMSYGRAKLLRGHESDIRSDPVFILWKMLA